MAVLTPTVVQFHSITAVRAVRTTAIPFLKMYEEKGSTVVYLLPVHSKCNAIFLRTILSVRSLRLSEVPSSKNIISYKYSRSLDSAERLLCRFIKKIFTSYIATCFLEWMCPRHCTSYDKKIDV